MSGVASGLKVKLLEFCFSWVQQLIRRGLLVLWSAFLITPQCQQYLFCKMFSIKPSSSASLSAVLFTFCITICCHLPFTPSTFALDLPQFGPILERCFTSTHSIGGSSPSHQYVGLNETELECCLLKDIAQCHHRDCFTAASSLARSSSLSPSTPPPLHMECNSTSLQLTRSLITAACSKTDIPEAEVGDYCSRRWVALKGRADQTAAEQYRCKVTIWALVALLFLQAVVFIFWAQLTDVGRVIKNRARNYVFFL